MPRYVFRAASAVAHQPIPPGMRIVEPAPVEGGRAADALYPGDVVEVDHELDEVDHGLWEPVVPAPPAAPAAPASAPAPPPRPPAPTPAPPKEA